MAGKSGEKLKFFPFEQDTLTLTCGSKIRSKFLNLLPFSRYFQNVIFSKSKMAAKSDNNFNFSPRHRILLYYPMGQKFARNRSISYYSLDIFNVLLSAKIQDGHLKWRKYSPLNRIFFY